MIFVKEPGVVPGHWVDTPFTIGVNWTMLTNPDALLAQFSPSTRQEKL